MPTYILSALDDPFIDARQLPYQLAEASERVYLEIARHGGHTGFVKPRAEAYHWYEKRFFEFVEALNEPSHREPTEATVTR